MLTLAISGAFSGKVTLADDTPKMFLNAEISWPRRLFSDTDARNLPSNSCFLPAVRSAMLLLNRILCASMLVFSAAAR